MEINKVKGAEQKTHSVSEIGSSKTIIQYQHIEKIVWQAIQQTHKYNRSHQVVHRPWVQVNKYPGNITYHHKARIVPKESLKPNQPK